MAALVLRDPDPGRSPFPRAAGATVASVLVAAIAVGAVALYGTVVESAAPRWGDGPAVLVEKESGARLVYREGTLHPVPNHVSALLLVGPGVETVLVSQKSIDELPRGVPLGIDGAPDAVPDPRRLASGAWTVCSTPDGAAVMVGAAAGGAPLAERGLLVRAGRDLHLVWQQRRHLLRDRDLVLSALGWTAERPTTVAPGLLAALPEGPDLARVAIEDAGGATTVPDAEVGDVFLTESQGGGRQYAVALAGGLAPITQLQADLLLTDLGQREPARLAQGEFADLLRLPALDSAGLPATTPPLAGQTTTVCASLPDVSVRVGASVPRTGVVVPPGGAALVEAGGTVYLVTDRGRRHAMSDREVPALLGYGEVRPLRLPASVVELLPEGVRLDPAVARAPLAD